MKREKRKIPLYLLKNKREKKKEKKEPHFFVLQKSENLKVKIF